MARETTTPTGRNPRRRSGRSGLRYLEHEELYREALLKGLEEASASLWLATANLKQTLVERPGRPGTMSGPGGAGRKRPGRFRPLAGALAELAAKGVEVRLLHAGAPSQPFVESLERLGAGRNPGGPLSGSLSAVAQAGAGGRPNVPGFEMRRCVRVHFKTIIVDGASAYIGSANLTGAGLGAKAPERRNFEMGLWLEDREIVRRIRDLFSAVWDGAFCAGCGRADDCPDPVAAP